MTDDRLRERLDRLERDNRRLKRVGVVIGVLLMAALGMGQTPGKRVITANEFVLIDGKGEHRMVLAVKEEQPAFALYDGHGQRRALLTLDKDGRPAFALADANGEARLSLGLRHGGEPRLSLLDATGHLQLGLGMVIGEPHFWMCDADREVRVRLLLSAGKPELTMYGAEGRAHVWIKADNDGSVIDLGGAAGEQQVILSATGGGHLELNDEGGGHVWVDADNHGSVIDLGGPAGERQVMLSASVDGGGLVLYDNNGAKLLQAVANEAGGGSLWAYGPDEIKGAGLGGTKSGGLVTVHAADGALKASLPPLAWPGLATATPLPLSRTSDVIESRIDGEFKGWDGDTIFKLANGQIWQQASYDYTYHYAYRPEVIIFQTVGGYKMKVDGVTDTIHVKRLK